MMTSLPVTPADRFPFNTTLATFGSCHQVTPVAQILAASVRTTGVPSAAIAPYKLECESLATTSAPGSNLCYASQIETTLSTLHCQLATALASLRGGALGKKLGDVEVYIVSVMENDRLDRALQLVAFMPVGGDDVHDFAGNSVLV